MLIAEKCANRSSPPPSGVINPKPFASLNHFTVPVAIVGNSLSTRIKRDVARPMFRSQGKYGGRTTAWRSYRACFTAWNKTQAGTIRESGKKGESCHAVAGALQFCGGEDCATNDRSSAVEFGSNDGGAGCKRPQLASGDVARKRDHPAVGTRIRP